MSTFKKWLSRIGTVILILFAVVVFYRYYVLEREAQTAVQVEKIHATKLTVDDVMGTHLPPSPSGRAGEGFDYDATIAGLDANQNGIRDDVELAIFAAYPNSAKTRAVLLQYALALQMETTQQLTNQGTVIAVAQDRSRAAMCIADLTPRTDIQKFIDTTRNLTDFVKNKQINTKERDAAQANFYKKIGSYSDLDGTCDLDLTTFTN